jgi:DNA-binding response OmpR family regulator
MVTAANGREAVELFRREPFDLVILDWVYVLVGRAALCALTSLRCAGDAQTKRRRCSPRHA